MAKVQPQIYDTKTENQNAIEQKKNVIRQLKTTVKLSTIVALLQLEMLTSTWIVVLMLI